MIKDRNNLNGIIARAARTSLGAIVAGAMCVAAGSARASYTGTVAVDWGTDTSITTIENAFDTALDPALKKLGVTGVSVVITGAVADSTYTADSNVVGTVSTGGTVTPYTLTNYVGSGDTFLQNISEPVGGQQATNSFTIAFENTSGKAVPIDIHDISFDYEIFPNINCTALGSSCGGSGNLDLPSLNVTDTYISSTGKSTTPAMVFQRWGVVPGGASYVGGQGYHGNGYTLNQGSITNPDDPLASCSGVSSTTQKDCGGSGTVVATTSTTTYNGTPGPGQVGDVTDHSGTTGAQVTSTTKNRVKTYSVTSTSDRETAPQLLGTSGTVSLTVGKGVTALTFNDWPATIAISQISFQVPEPGSWSMIVPGLFLFGFLLSRRKRPTA